MVSPACNFQAHECFDYDSFKIGVCSSCGADNTKCAFMGIRADEYVDKDRTNVRLYVDTDADTPFCYYHYQVSILTAHPSDAEDWVVGNLHTTLYGDKGAVLENVQISDEYRRIDHGRVNTFQFTSHKDLGVIMRIELKWNYDAQFLKPGTYCWGILCNRGLCIKSLEVSNTNYYPESERLEHTQRLCAIDGSDLEIKNGNTEDIVPTQVCVPVVDQ